MPRINCPKCDTRIKIPEDYDRPTIKCPECGKKVAIDEDDDERDDAPRKKSEPKPSGVGGCLAIGGYSLALLLIAVSGAVAFYSIGIAFVMAVIAGVLISIVAAIAGMISYFVAMGRGTSKLKAYAPWFGLMLVGLAMWIGPLVLHTMAQKNGWYGQDEKLAKGAKDADKGNAARDADAKVDDGKKLDDKGKAPKDIDDKAKAGKDMDNKGIDRDKKPPIEVPKVVKVQLKMTGDAELDAKFTDLQGPDGKRFKAAIDSIAAMPPNEHRAVVAQNLAELAKTAHVSKRTALLRAVGIWGTAEETPILVPLLTDPDINTRNETLQALGKIKDERAAAPMVKCLLETSTLANAEQALKAMGPIAETEVITVLKQKSNPPKLAAIRVLSEIGTEKSIPALEDASKSLALRSVSQKAIAAINARIKK